VYVFVEEKNPEKLSVELEKQKRKFGRGNTLATSGSFVMKIIIKES